MNLPQSVPTHLANADPSFWMPKAKDFEWRSLDVASTYAISGSAFVDLDDPYGILGNPFAVVIGDKVNDLDSNQSKAIAQKTGTPETVFIRRCRSKVANEYELLLTVLTPTGKELGACAHGFTGAIQTLLNCGKILADSRVEITTTLDTTANASVSTTGIISLEFAVQEQRRLTLPAQTINDIFQAEVLLDTTKLSVLSVGSPKLIIEVSPEVFMNVQSKLTDLDYDKLLALEDKEHFNGIHLFCRNLASQLPEKAIQVNAYLGKVNVVDPATGVSAAAQISADTNVSEGTEVTIAQYTAKGPSAILKVTKGVNTVNVGGTAVLFNYKELESQK